MALTKLDQERASTPQATWSCSPRKRTRELLSAVQARRVDRRVESTTDLALGDEEAEERSQVPHDVLKARPRDAAPYRADERLDLRRPDPSQDRALTIEVEERQQL